MRGGGQRADSWVGGLMEDGARGCSRCLVGAAVSKVFISYARTDALLAQRVAEGLRAAGFEVWRDDELPAHRSYAEVIEERLDAAKAVVVIWSQHSARSEWVQSEADRARNARKLVQLSVDGTALPMPFDRIQCADMAGWLGAPDAPGWRKVLGSLTELVEGGPAPAPARAAAALVLPNKPSVAVLPFANLSGDAEQDYFADGMVEEITAALTRFKSIFVIASSSTLPFKGRSIGPEVIARQLGVRYVLEGSVRRAMNRVRIAAKLIDAEEGAQIWAHRFEDTLDDVFALQDRVAQEVASVIEPTVREAELRRAARRPTDNMTSYDCFLRAVPLWRELRPETVLQAQQLADQAVALDPQFGQALDTAALCRAIAITYGWTTDPEGERARAIALTQRALRSSGDDANVLAGVANTLVMLQADLATAKELLERAVLLNPGSATVWHMSGLVHIRLGEPEIGIAHLEMATRYDPLSLVRVHRDLAIGVARFQQGQMGEAVNLLKQAGDLFGSPHSPALLAAAYGHLGRTEEVREAFAVFRDRYAGPIQDAVVSWIGRPEHRSLLISGLELAEAAARDAAIDAAVH